MTLTTPLSPLCLVDQALLECLLQMRSDAYKILRLHRRPEASPAQDIGLWSSVIDAMGFFGVLVNVGIICFTTGTLSGYDEVQKWLVYLVSGRVVDGPRRVLPVHLHHPDQRAAMTLPLSGSSACVGDDVALPNNRWRSRR